MTTKLHPITFISNNPPRMKSVLDRCAPQTNGSLVDSENQIVRLNINFSLLTDKPLWASVMLNAADRIANGLPENSELPIIVLDGNQFSPLLPYMKVSPNKFEYHNNMLMFAGNDSISNRPIIVSGISRAVRFFCLTKSDLNTSLYIGSPEEHRSDQPPIEQAIDDLWRNLPYEDL